MFKNFNNNFKVPNHGNKSKQAVDGEQILSGNDSFSDLQDKNWQRNLSFFLLERIK